MLDGMTLEEAQFTLNEQEIKKAWMEPFPLGPESVMRERENTKETPLLFKCVTDADTFIIPVGDIICMKPIISQDGDPYIRVTYEDSETRTTSTIYCSEVELLKTNICIQGTTSTYYPPKP